MVTQDFGNADHFAVWAATERLLMAAGSLERAIRLIALANERYGQAHVPGNPAGIVRANTLARNRFPRRTEG